MQEKMKVKYNKKRNTAFLYETLVMELTKSIVTKNNDRKNIVMNIIKECFHKSSVLHKELDVYKSLYETKGLQLDVANRLIQEARRIYCSLNNKDIFNQQTQVINKMNKQLEQTVFSNFLPNYKDLATISQLFDDDISIKQKVLLEQLIVDMMCENKIEKEQMRPIDNIVYKQVIRKFNEKYSDGLLEEQKTLFSKYILSYSDNDNIDLIVYLNEEISRIKNTITASTIKEQDKKSLLEKIDKVKDKPINKEAIEDILNFQSLIKELEA